MDGWNTTFLLGRPIFRGYVSFREGILKVDLLHCGQAKNSKTLFLKRKKNHWMKIQRSVQNNGMNPIITQKRYHIRNVFQIGFRCFFQKDSISNSLFCCLMAVFFETTIFLLPTHRISLNERRRWWFHGAMKLFWAVSSRFWLPFFFRCAEKRHETIRGVWAVFLTGFVELMSWGVVEKKIGRTSRMTWNLLVVWKNSGA